MTIPVLNLIVTIGATAIVFLLLGVVLEMIYATSAIGRALARRDAVIARLRHEVAFYRRLDGFSARGPRKQV